MTDWLLSFDTAAPGLLLAFVAGGVNSLSPCCLAMTPAFLAHLAGVEVEVPTRRQRLLHASLYILGFSLVFITIGAGLSLAGMALTDSRAALWKVGGVLVITFGLMQMGLLTVPFLSRSFEVRVADRQAPGMARSLLVGATYSLAWTPCIGPVLGAILTGVLVFGEFWQGVALLTAFAAGMAVPHFAAALAFERLAAVRAALNRHYLAVQRVSGTVMVGMGVLIFTGALIEIFRYFQSANVVL
ncbi:MAG: cytochrome c biogenesis CcdA family protein [Tepidiformaceae bacterium]